MEASKNPQQSLPFVAMQVAKALNAINRDPTERPGLRNFLGSRADDLAQAIGVCPDCPCIGGELADCCELIPPPCYAEREPLERIEKALAAYDAAMTACPVRKPHGVKHASCPRCRASANEVCILDAVESGNFVGAVRAALDGVPPPDGWSIAKAERRSNA